MGTAEIIIVFSALMALIALVTIGIDWIGKPLKHRRFIPRMYRFEDEKLPIDAYGHTDFHVPGIAGAGQPAPLLYMQPPPVVVAHVTQTMAPATPHPQGAADTIAVQVTQPEHKDRANPAGTPPAIPVAAPAAATGHAFSDSLRGSASDGAAVVSDAEQWLAAGLVPNEQPSAALAPPAGIAWQPDMALDTTIDDRKPNLATKAQRFWMATAYALGESHFDAEDIVRMQGGKAPRRTNPRTGRAETMQLTGLRQASRPSGVRMRWPEDAIDPWSAT